MISILMPVRNAGPYLADCLTSIINQTHTDWELIAINDHSDDQSPEILHEFSLKEQRIRCYDNIGRGIIHALRTAYQHSAGDQITRMDADDLMSIDKLDAMSTLLHESGPGHLITGLVEYFSEAKLGEGYLKYAKWLNDLSRGENNFEDIYKECVIPSPCWMLFRADFERCGAFKSDKYPEDYDLCFRFREAGLTVRSVKKVIHFWRDHSDRASRNDPNYLDNRFIELKMHHFLKSDYDATSSLILWGAGKKAKAIAQHLIDNHVSFRWVCNNPNKIGKDIYGQKLESLEIVDDISGGVCLVAVANKNDQIEIKHNLSQSQDIKAIFMC